MKEGYSILVFAVLIGLTMAFSAEANNVSLSTPILTEPNSTQNYTYIQFDLSWENSFRDDLNWDAVWLFVKYKETGSSEWNHAYLNPTAGNHTIPAGYTCSVGLTGSYGMGVFIYRGSSGSGNSTLSDVQLRWEYGDNGLPDDATVTVSVFAIEMVYVPQGSFNLNTTASVNMYNEFFDDGGSTTQITSENALAEGAIRWKKDTSPGGVGNDNGTSYGSDALGASYPKGYAAFYCMKYEISQAQYAAFLNTLTSAGASNRYPNRNGNYRHTVTGAHPNYSASRSDRACNYLSWMDGCAYADWAGLRPMTELEFEKACRGDQSVVADEFAWGTTNIAAATTISGTEDGTETVSNADANCCYGGNFFTGGDGGGGPLRCGIFAKAGTTREQAGASYYGIMEFSGSLHDRCVTVADKDQGSTTTNAGLFDGSPGDGSLSTDGYATNATWPGYSGGKVTGDLGAGHRGGWWSTSDANYQCVSDREGSGYTHTGADNATGFRCVRSASESFTPSGSPGGAQYYGGSYDGYTMQTSPPDISLPVTLSTFTAQAGDGKVILHWVTESETDNLGFHVYRALSEDGEYQRLTAEIIRGAGNTSTRQSYSFTDIRLTNGVTYWYKIEDVAFDGTTEMHGPTGVTPQAKEEVLVSLPEKYALSPCYPNPFNSGTVITYQLPESGYVRLAIYDVLGQEVRVLTSEMQPAGWYRVTWDAKDGAGRLVSSGVYLYRMQIGEQFLQTRKMVLVR